MKDALGGQSLLSIYSVYEKLKSTKSAPATTAPPIVPSASPKSSPITPEQKAEAEALKAQGNTSMASKNYTDAIAAYTQALELSPANAIYLSNRAAAYSASNQHPLAEADARAATVSDPSYTKAWSRLGLALFAQQDAKGAMEAYQTGIDAEGNGGSEVMKKGFETAKRKVQEESAMESSSNSTARSAGGAGAGAGVGGMPDLSALAGMFGGGGGAGAGGGPDLSSIMSNPMFASMAQNLMSNPGLMDNIMSNPKMRDMAQQFGGGGGGAPTAGDAGAGGAGRGGMPDVAALLQDPSIAEL